MSLTGPADDGGRIHGGAADGGRAGETVTVCSRDGGVSTRLTRRCRIAASGLLVAGGCLLTAAVLRQWDTVSALLTLLAAATLVGAAIMAARARLWRTVAPREIDPASGRPGTVGEPRPLSPGRPGAPVQRKVGAVVVPIRLPAGPQPGGGALIVHGRRDGVTVAASDAVLVWAVARGALVSPPGTAERTATTPAGRPLNPGDTGNACSGRRFVMYRERDGAVFLATSRLTDTW